MARRRLTSVSDTDEDFLWSGLAWRPKITKVMFRPCGLSASLRHHEFLAQSRQDFTLGRRLRIVTALCNEFHDRWNVSRYRFLCVRVTRLVCVRQARVARSNLAYVTCLAAQSDQEFRSC